MVSPRMATSAVRAGAPVPSRPTGTFTAYRHDPDDPTSLSNDFVRAVYEDSNGDGVRGAAELGLEGVTVELRDAVSDVLVASAVTDADGHYHFTDPGDGTYKVVEQQPVGLDVVPATRFIRLAVDSQGRALERQPGLPGGAERRSRPRPGEAAGAAVGQGGAAPGDRFQIAGPVLFHGSQRLCN